MTSPVLRVGCAMWAYKAWQGLHLPDHLERSEQLATYATWCNAVEGGTTYYGVPAARTVAAWAEEAPADLRLLFKLPRTITHEHLLRDAAADLVSFLERIEPLGARAEQLAIQLPKSFGPGDLDALAAFVGRLPQSHRFAVELRHRSFSEDPALRSTVEALLGRNAVEWISLDTTTLYGLTTPSDAERTSRRQKPRLPRRTDALTDRPVVRFVGVDDPAATRAGWATWLPILAGWLAEGREPSVFVHTPDNLAAPVLARALHADVAALVPGLRPLPVPRRAVPEATSAEPASVQPTLFTA